MLLSLSASLILIHCTGSITSGDPTGFGVWTEDCRSIGVAVNQADFDGRMFMNHETNQRCDLHLCDSTGKIIKTLFSSRYADDHPTRIDSIAFSTGQDTLIFWSLLYGTGTVKKEKISLSDGTITELETIDVLDWSSKSMITSAPCNGRCIKWNHATSWISVGTDCGW